MTMNDQAGQVELVRRGKPEQATDRVIYGKPTMDADNGYVPADQTERPDRTPPRTVQRTCREPKNMNSGSGSTSGSTSSTSGSWSVDLVKVLFELIPECKPTETVPTLAGTTYTRELGDKEYELKDHLGNVRVVVTDIKNSTINQKTHMPEQFTADLNSYFNYYTFGMIMPGRSFNPTDYRFGFNGKEKDDEVKGSGNSYDFGARIYDSRLGHWLSVDPLSGKYPFASPYNFALNNPINAIDPDGKDVVFVNGFSHHDNNNKFRGGGVSAWRKKNYWNNENKTFTNKVGKYFNDDNHHFLSASQNYGSKAVDRQKDGYNTALQMVKSGEIILSADNPITVVMHSQGNAFGAGYMQGILAAGKAAGIDVKVNGVMLSVHQPGDINTEGIEDKSIQFTYGNDNSRIVAPMGKVPGVADANPTNKNNDEGGLDAHSATIDKDEAFDAIKKVDKEKGIFTKKSKKD